MKNILIVAKLNGNDWRPFTFEQYCIFCNHIIGKSEKSVFEFISGQRTHICFTLGSGSTSSISPCLTYDKDTNQYNYIFPAFTNQFRVNVR